jgi:predicted transcriptional regulator
MERLYELADQIKSYLEVELLPEELAEQFERIQMVFTDKVLASVRLIKNWEAETEAIKAEESRLSQRRKSLQGKIESLKEYIKGQMEFVNIPQIRDEIFTVTVRKNPVSCEVKEPILLPEAYRKFEWIPLKTDIIDHFKKTGEIVAGARIITDKTRLDIK